MSSEIVRITAHISIKNKAVLFWTAFVNRKNRDTGRWKNPPLSLVGWVCDAVLILTQCSEKGLVLGDEDHRVISALVKAVKLNRDLRNAPDSLDQARQALLSEHDLTAADLNQWLETNKDNLAMWREVEAQIQRGIDEKKEGSPRPLAP